MYILWRVLVLNMLLMLYKEQIQQAVTSQRPNGKRANKSHYQGSWMGFQKFIPITLFNMILNLNKETKFLYWHQLLICLHPPYLQIYLYYGMWYIHIAYLYKRYIFVDYLYILTIRITETPKRVLWQTVKIQMKCRIMRLFIRVCTVC